MVRPGQGGLEIAPQELQQRVVECVAGVEGPVAQGPQQAAQVEDEVGLRRDDLRAEDPLLLPVPALRLVDGDAADAAVDGQVKRVLQQLRVGPERVGAGARQHGVPAAAQVGQDERPQLRVESQTVTADGQAVDGLAGEVPQAFPWGHGQGVLAGDGLRAVRDAAARARDEDRFVAAGDVREALIGLLEHPAAAVAQQGLQVEVVEAEAADEDGVARAQLLDRSLRREPRRQVGEARAAGDALPVGALVAQGGRDVSHAQDDGVDLERATVGQGQ